VNDFTYLAILRIFFGRLVTLRGVCVFIQVTADAA